MCFAYLSFKWSAIFDCLCFHFLNCSIYRIRFIISIILYFQLFSIIRSGILFEKGFIPHHLPHNALNRIETANICVFFRKKRRYQNIVSALCKNIVYFYSIFVSWRFQLFCKSFLWYLSYGLTSLFSLYLYLYVKVKT